MAEAQDVETLKKRGRRRLVGAVALVLAAVIILPMVFDPEPRRAEVAVSVRIPGENETQFTPKVTPKAPDKPVLAEEKKAVEEKKREPRKVETFYVPVGAFADPQGATAKLAGARIPYYTEDLAITGGKVTRVRAGPFASKDAAEKAIERLKGLGFKPGSVAAKSG